MCVKPCVCVCVAAAVPSAECASGSGGRDHVDRLRPDQHRQQRCRGSPQQLQGLRGECLHPARRPHASHVSHHTIESFYCLVYYHHPFSGFVETHFLRVFSQLMFNTHTHTLTHSLTHSLTRSLTHTFIYTTLTHLHMQLHYTHLWNANSHPLTLSLTHTHTPLQSH